MKKEFLLIANGEVNKRIIEKTKEHTFYKIIAADGGAVKALEFGLLPNVVIGDLDSLPYNFSEQNPQIEIIKKPSQELNDLEKALVYCWENGATRVVAVGITEGRVDHTFNNFSVLAKFQQKFDLLIFNNHATIYLVQSSIAFAAKPGQTISLIPLGKVKGVTTHGLKYILNKESLELGVREGASNEAIAENVIISIEQGTLLVFINDVD